jgi:hypothetical protein
VCLKAPIFTPARNGHEAQEALQGTKPHTMISLDCLCVLRASQLEGRSAKFTARNPHAGHPAIKVAE